MDAAPNEPRVRSIAPRARVVVAAFAVTIALLLGSIWHDFALIALLRRALSGLATPADAAALDRAEVWIAGAYLLTVVATAVVFCMWIHRSYSNLVAAGVSGLRYTPRRSVAAFFIPFVNLVRPFRVVNEIWGASRNLAAGSALAPGDARKETHWTVGVWWLSMLLGNGYARVTSAMLDAAKTPADFERYASQSLVADAVTLIAAAMAIVIVRTISGWQETARATRVSGAAMP